MTTEHGAKPIIVFDVNETLLDIEVLAPLFRKVFGSERVMREWFAQMILYSEAFTLSGTYAPFGTIGAGVLRMLAEAKHASITEADVEDLRSLMQTMPAHPEVPDALRRLKEAGFRLVTLTNSAPQPGRSPLERAGIAACFEQQFSIDTVKRYKPAPQTYEMVAQALGVSTSSLCLVAAHPWDTLGAQKAGCTAALVTRPGNAPLVVATLPQPGIIGSDLTDVAEQIIQRWPTRAEEED